LTQQAEIKKAKTLLAYYVKKTGERVNVTQDFWDFIELGVVLTNKEIKGLIDYFAEIDNKQNIKWFFANYTKLEDAKKTRDADRERRKEILRESQERTAEWQRKHQKSN